MALRSIGRNMQQQRSVRRARRQRGKPTSGYFVTWDVNSADRRQCARIPRVGYGDQSVYDRKTYRYPGFVEQDGVQYIGQSVLFVTEARLRAILEFLRVEGVNHVVRYG